MIFKYKYLLLAALFTTLTQAMQNQEQKSNSQATTIPTNISAQVVLQNARQPQSALMDLVVAQFTDADYKKFFEAVKDDNYAIVESYIKKKIDINKKSLEGDTALNYAACSCNRAIVKLLLQNGAIADTASSSGFRALHWSAYYGDQEITQLLLQHSATIDIEDNSGNTPLCWAASNNKKNMVIMLVQNNASVVPRAIHTAINNKHEQIVYYLKSLMRISIR